MSSDQASAAASEENQLLRIRDDQGTQGTQPSGTGSANLPEYPIEGVFGNWIKDEHIRDMLSTVYATHGDWEGWVRVEIDLQFRDAFSIRMKQPVREVEVYKNAENFADLVLKPDENHKGLVIELICEDKFANKGSLIKSGIQDEMDKKRELKEEYKGYTSKVLALTYSKAAEIAVRGLGFTVMPGIEVDQACESDKLEEYASDEQPVTLRVFQKRIPSGFAGDGVDEIEESLGGLSSDGKAVDDKEAASSNNGGASGTSSTEFKDTIKGT